MDLSERLRKAGEKYDRKMAKKKAKMRKKADKIHAKDFKGCAARYTFYLNHDYDNPYTQTEWGELFKRALLAQERGDPDAMVPFYNAIVVEDGYYVRRGLENLKNSLIPFNPGKNDEVSYDYAIEPYRYKK